MKIEETPEEENPGEEIIPPTEENEEEEKETIPAEKEDSTVVEGVIPNAGKNILIICILVISCIITIGSYIRYKDIEIK